MTIYVHYNYKANKSAAGFKALELSSAIELLYSKRKTRLASVLATMVGSRAAAEQMDDTAVWPIWGVEKNNRTVTRNGILEYWCYTLILESRAEWRWWNTWPGVLQTRSTAEQSKQQLKQQSRKPAAQSRTEETAEEESHSRAGGTICFYSVTFFPSDRERTENIWWTATTKRKSWSLIRFSHRFFVECGSVSSHVTSPRTWSSTRWSMWPMRDTQSLDTWAHPEFKSNGGGTSKRA